MEQPREENRRYKMRGSAITENIDMSEVDIRELDDKGLYHLAARAECLVKRIKMKKGTEDGTEG